MEAGKGWAGRSVVIAKLGRRFDFDEILTIGLRSIYLKERVVLFFAFPK